MSLEAFAVSAGVVALGEIGDKTQLLTLILAARFRRPVPIIAGILVATLLNHATAAALGAWVQHAVPAEWLRIGLGVSFLAVAAWALKPDEAPDDTLPQASAFGVFGITATAFFLAEMGDKTQIATVMLAAQFGAPVTVTAGTTLGMLIADLPAVWLGDKLLARLPLVWIRRGAAAVFALLGVLVLAGVGS